jgi:hypothetical protein
VFYFLFRTYLWKEDGSRWVEPASLGFDSSKRTVKQHGVRFEEDKRLFMRDAPAGVSLDQWETHLTQSWQDLCQLYADCAEDKAAGQAYCQTALLGVALLILDDSDTVKHHAVKVDWHQEVHQSLLRFKPQLDNFLFKLSPEGGAEKAAYLHDFAPINQSGQPVLKNLQLQGLQTKPYLTAIETGELTPNPVLLIYGFSFGENVQDWKREVENRLIQAPFKRHPLLSTVMARLIVEQWQFGRMEEAADNLRPKLQSKSTYYTTYADQYADARPHCTQTRVLEKQLQEMQALVNEATFLVSRLEGAAQTLTINGNNLTRRLAQIRQEMAPKKWQLHLGSEQDKLQWLPQPDDDVALLEQFHRDTKRLQNHQVYLQQQIKYLNGLQNRWQLYLQTRKAQAGEYLNTLATVFILLLAGTGVTFNTRTFGVDVDAPFVWVMVIVLLSPILWHFGRWLTKQWCCIFHGTWLEKSFCGRVFQWTQSVGTFRWFTKR